MRKSIAAAAPLLLALGLPAGAVEMDGPMSSRKPPETPAAVADTTPPSEAKPGFDVEKLFANTCGWCHSRGGREAGKGPKLLGTALTDAEIIHRIKNGKTGAMPAFGSAFKDDEIQAIVKYIRELKEEGPAK